MKEYHARHGPALSTAWRAHPDREDGGDGLRLRAHRARVPRNGCWPACCAELQQSAGFGTTQQNNTLTANGKPIRR